MVISGFFRKSILSVVALFLTATCTAFAQQAWKPEKNVEIVVGLTPGSSQDRSARLLQSIWQNKNVVGVPVTVANRVGGAGNIARINIAGMGRDHGLGRHRRKLGLTQAGIELGGELLLTIYPTRYRTIGPDGLDEPGDFTTEPQETS